MATATGDRKVSDLTVNDLRRLIRDTIYEFVDSDFGLELRPEGVIKIKGKNPCG